MHSEFGTDLCPVPIEFMKEKTISFGNEPTLHKTAGDGMPQGFAFYGF